MSQETAPIPKPVLCRLRRVRWNHRFTVLACILVLVAAYTSGVLFRPFERNFRYEFTYPLDVDVTRLVLQLKQNVTLPDVDPINVFRHSLIISSVKRCDPQPNFNLLFVIKSAVGNFERRTVIRQTWGSANRYVRGVDRVFLLGTPSDSKVSQWDVEEEQYIFRDLVQGDFLDSYRNNALKMLMGLRWVSEHCQSAAYVMFVDDDYYVSTVNVLRLLGRLSALSEVYVGKVFADESPIRKLWDKWSLSLSVYPYDRLPPFVNAGAYVLSFQSVLTLYYGSLYTAPFPFDDVYLGIVALKTNVSLTDHPGFFNYKVPYTGANYANFVAVHGFHDTGELFDVWSQMHDFGYA